MNTPSVQGFRPAGADTSATILKIAIFAVGGQGGGVLSNWVADLAELGGYQAQVTSVAGVAQRTGATIYYIEMAPKSDDLPVFALAPTPGDLDIVMASELMEAGRSVMRGFVTPDRTTLIASSHRILAVSEKQQPGDGRSNNQEVADSLGAAAETLICFDMERLARKAGSVISASLFGGLARSGALPFEQALFEEVIRASDRGVETSLAAFRAALECEPETDAPTESFAPFEVTGPEELLKEWSALTVRAEALPPQVQPMVLAGLQAVVDYQDTDYGAEYLDHLSPVLAQDRADRDYVLTEAAAKYIARAMCYDDILRVADLKTRASRNARLRREQQTGSGDIVHVTEYFHPRVEELTSILPARLGRWTERASLPRWVLGRIVGNGKRIRSDRIGGFALLWLAAALRPVRRRLLRHQAETAHLDRLIGTSLSRLPQHYDLAVEIFLCQRLIKGYSDTHWRGHSKFNKVLGALDQLAGRKDAHDWIRRLRDAALLDEKGDALEGALKTIQSFFPAA